MNTGAIRDLVRMECLGDSNRFGAAFYDQHIVPVVLYATRLAERYDADQTVVELAGYLHDLSAVRDISVLATHHIKSARIARDLLEAGGWPEYVTAAVCRSIESHSAPVAAGNGTPEEVCISNADVMSHIARPGYWLFYLYSVRGMAYEDGLSWLRTRVETLWTALTDDARQIVAAEHATAASLLESAAANLSATKA